MLTIWEIVNAKIISNKIHTPVRKFINPFLFVIYEIVKNSPTPKLQNFTIFKN